MKYGPCDCGGCEDCGYFDDTDDGLTETERRARAEDAENERIEAAIDRFLDTAHEWAREEYPR